MAVQYDNDNEPFLQLPEPHSHLRLTAPRESDGPDVIEAMNDRSVYMNLLNPPFPYLEKDWHEFYPILRDLQQKARAELKEVEEWRHDGAVGEKKWIGAGLPFHSIREVNAVTGEEKFLGKISIRRSDFLWLTENSEKRMRMRDENKALPNGDPKIEWELGFWLVPSAHGRGIMAAVLRTLMDTFFVGYMNVQHLNGGFFDHNIGSRRVLEKCGFVFEVVKPDVVEFPESKTGVKGKKVGLGLMTWTP
ncbi:hypothetical protein GTA08_BOTSDO10325 [Neofusicoccum parvum]|uniref:Uncharacterized protein n=1 Tax=Neofusicoccum parvum TaxID=310453 RepID=A0ACB5RTH9_9PEZI|nr:hypothetical protein GTA08_BOTSDO10325 [Neofusicoccum parvum]